MSTEHRLVERASSDRELLDPAPVDRSLMDHSLVEGLRTEVLAALSERTRGHQAGGRPPLGPADEQALGRQLIADALERRAREALGAGEAVMSEGEEDFLARAAFDALFRLNRLQRLLDDPGIENINANGCDVVWVRYADGRREQVDPIADSDAGAGGDAAHRRRPGSGSASGASTGARRGSPCSCPTDRGCSR